MANVDFEGLGGFKGVYGLRRLEGSCGGVSGGHHERGGRGTGDKTWAAY